MFTLVALVNLLVAVAIFLLILWLVKLVLAQIPLPAPIMQIIWIIVGLVFLLYALGLFGLYPLPLK